MAGISILSTVVAWDNTSSIVANDIVPSVLTGTVKLLDGGRAGAMRVACWWLRCSGNAGDLGPNLKGLGAGGPILGGRHLMAAEVEEVIDPVVGGQEALRLAG